MLQLGWLLPESSVGESSQPRSSEVLLYIRGRHCTTSQQASCTLWFLQYANSTVRLQSHISSSSATTLSGRLVRINLPAQLANPLDSLTLARYQFHSHYHSPYCRIITLLYQVSSNRQTHNNTSSASFSASSNVPKLILCRRSSSSRT